MRLQLLWGAARLGCRAAPGGLHTAQTLPQQSPAGAAPTPQPSRPTPLLETYLSPTTFPLAGSYLQAVSGVVAGVRICVGTTHIEVPRRYPEAKNSGQLMRTAQVQEALAVMHGRPEPNRLLGGEGGGSGTVQCLIKSCLVNCCLQVEFAGLALRELVHCMQPRSNVRQKAAGALCAHACWAR